MQPSKVVKPVENPPPDPIGKGANLFQQLAYLVKFAVYLIPESLNTRLQLENLILMTDQLQSDLDANTAAVAAAQTAITAEIAQLQAAIAALSTNAAPTQAQLDQLTASTTALQSATASLTADDSAAPAA